MYSLINRLFSPAREFLNPVSKLMIASFLGGAFLVTQTVKNLPRMQKSKEIMLS